MKKKIVVTNITCSILIILILISHVFADAGEREYQEAYQDFKSLDISKAKKYLGWEPKHHLLETLPKMIDKLKKDPVAFYKNNGLTPPKWLTK